MATYVLKRKNFGFLSGAAKGGVIGAIIGAMPFFSNDCDNSRKNVFLLATTTFGALIGGLCGLFFGNKSNANKYKASPEEIQAIIPELPKEYEVMKKIKLEVIKQCRYIFASDTSIDFFCNKLPGFMNLNGEEWIAGWARETSNSTEGKKRYAPIFAMYKENRQYYIWDFNRKEWMILIGNKTYYIKKEFSLFKFMLSELNRFKEYNKNYVTQPNANLTLVGEIDTYLDLNIKLIKKYGKL